ncbi:DeoR/GlpR family DNA-binding transcription regulator [Acidisoma sp.]|uniref:DeoR/GlpR family DNA-binding transcription regulator n=1 Tax=Acidisoma sp. TaxID=1872115 RepID=UPI003AFF8B23
MTADSEELVLPGSRQRRLADYMRVKGHVTVVELTTMFGVSRDTIRRDLQLLERHGLLTRTHGGALAGEGLVARETRFQARMAAQAPAKRRIGRAAAGLIREGETLILNGGSTTCCFAAELGKLRDLTIVTNNLMLPQMVASNAARSVYVLGGAYWESAQITIGTVKIAGSARISVDTAVIGVTGIDATGLSISRLEESQETVEMMEAARRVIVVADSSKFGVNAFAHVAGFNRIQYLVSDATPPSDIADALAQAGVEVIVGPV